MPASSQGSSTDAQESEETGLSTTASTPRVTAVSPFSAWSCGAVFSDEGGIGRAVLLAREADALFDPLPVLNIQRRSEIHYLRTLNADAGGVDVVGVEFSVCTSAAGSAAALSCAGASAAAGASLAAGALLLPQAHSANIMTIASRRDNAFFIFFPFIFILRIGAYFNCSTSYVEHISITR